MNFKNLAPHYNGYICVIKTIKSFVKNIRSVRMANFVYYIRLTLLTGIELSTVEYDLAQRYTRVLALKYLYIMGNLNLL